MRSKMTGVAITLVAIVVALSALDRSLAQGGIGGVACRGPAFLS